MGMGRIARNGGSGNNCEMGTVTEEDQYQCQPRSGPGIDRRASTA